MNKLYQCDICTSKVEHVAIIFPETDDEQYFCKKCLESLWADIYEKETSDAVQRGL
jgi:predicted SprT family Zn-dependent metalloprotease